MMKKLLVFLVMISLLGLGLLGVFGVIVMAVSQPINVTISPDIHVLISPGAVSFGSVVPNTTNNAAVENVSFNATGSNVNVSIEVTNVSTEPFTSGLKFDGVLAATPVSYILNCVGSPCAYTVKIVDTTLDVPLSFPKGLKAGTITYLITDADP